MIQKNLVLQTAEHKPIVFDLFYNDSSEPKPLVIFCHGYKGFKDWGAWDLVAKQFLNANMFFVKFNFSHNGGSVNEPIDFPDLDAFAENNYSKELKDLDRIIAFFTAIDSEYHKEIDINNIILIGHSRGGGIATIKASEQPHIKSLITWASVSDFGSRFSALADLETWKKEGVVYVLNSRTKQQLPHHYQFYTDFKTHETRLTIENAVKALKIPHLILHAQEDRSVSFEEALALKRWHPESVLSPITDSNHVFDASHPWESEKLPAALQEVTNRSLDFIKKHEN